MTTEKWKEQIITAVKDNDATTIGLLAEICEESERAKQILRDKGYGWTGLSLLKTVTEEVPESK